MFSTPSISKHRIIQLFFLLVIFSLFVSIVYCLTAGYINYVPIFGVITFVISMLALMYNQR